MSIYAIKPHTQCRYKCVEQAIWGGKTNAAEVIFPSIFAPKCSKK